MDSPNSTNDSWSSELEAMRAVAEALGALDGDDARRRVLAWAAGHFGVQAMVAAQGGSGGDHAAPGAGGDDGALDVPSEAELYARAPRRSDDRGTLDDLIVHRSAIDRDALAIETTVVAAMPEPDLTVDLSEPAPIVAATAARLDLQALLRSLVDEFDALVKAWQTETACAA